MTLFSNSSALGSLSANRLGGLYVNDQPSSYAARTTAAAFDSTGTFLIAEKFLSAVPE